MRRKKQQAAPARIPFRMHPRVFAALGADLVTNDVVAIIELVKNSYDAFAANVWVRFGTDAREGPYIEVEDDGHGMDRSTIEDVWCLVATPFRSTKPVAKKGSKERRVAGEKGLGRLAVARLGDRLEMLTQAPGSPCWRVEVKWSDVSSADDLASCFANCQEVDAEPPFQASGTRVRVYGLRSDWDMDRVSDLEENLARLLSPFEPVADFSIRLTPPGADAVQGEVRIEVPDFLAKPKYRIRGHADACGNVSCKYTYRPISRKKGRQVPLRLSWEQVHKVILDKAKQSRLDPKSAHCGPFEFEIRAWDIGPGDTEEIAERFDFQKSQVRKAIRAHKGISVYRDGILALPKSDSGRDWLGLDLRRVSKVGTRLSTSQLVGYVAISADRNPGIEDTSDRERFVASERLVEFEEILKAVVFLLENERDRDRVKRGEEKPLEDLFAELTAEDLLAEMVALAEEGAPAADAVPALRDFSDKLGRAREAIQRRFVFYSRLATVGTIAQMLVHEIRNRTTILGNLVRRVKEQLGAEHDSALVEKVRLAESAIDGLEQLADTFAPLASRSFRRKRRDALLEESIRRCLSLVAGDIEKMDIAVSAPKSSRTRVAVDPGELDAILLNLIANATYWLAQAPKDRRLLFRISRLHRDSRVRLSVHDSGPGVDEKDVEKVFWPGVTRKPGGIGMGLTVASELVAEYGGKMCAIHPGKLGGASFAFDLPLKR